MWNIVNEQLVEVKAVRAMAAEMTGSLNDSEDQAANFKAETARPKGS